MILYVYMYDARLVVGRYGMHGHELDSLFLLCHTNSRSTVPVSCIRASLCCLTISQEPVPVIFM